MTAPADQLQVIRAADRVHWRNEWLWSKQSFNATGNFDLAANAHGILMVHNEDFVDPGAGFDTHQHQDTEIVTWVLEGSVVHQDSAGHSGIVHPGLAQRMSAGTGILHSERNGAAWNEKPTLHVVQMWIPPDETGLAPSYQEMDIADALTDDTLVTVASGMRRHRDETAITLHNRYAALHVARMRTGAAVQIPDAPYGHLFVARGAVELESAGRLEQGDAVRLTATGGHTVTALEPSELLFWEMHASFA